MSKKNAEPASHPEAAALFDGLCAIYGTPEGWPLAARLYLELVRYPLPIMQAAVEAHIRTCKWFPKPSELIALAEPMMTELRAKLGDAQADFDFAHSDQYRTIDEYRKAKEAFYRNQSVGDGYGNRGSSALAATPDTPRWRPSPATLEVLKTWQTIPLPEQPEEETSATAAPEENT